MSKSIDKNGKEVEMYRFELGSLYKFDAGSDAYVHVYNNAFDNTKAKAIKAYEQSELWGE